MASRHWIYVLLVLVGVGACTRKLESEAPYQPDSSVLFTAPWWVGVLCKSPMGEMWFDGGAWTPSAGDLTAADAAFARMFSPTPAADTAARRAADIDAIIAVGEDAFSRPAASDYIRQFAGAVTVNDQRVICINAIDQQSAGDAWRRHPVTFIDGGWIQVSAVYDVASGEIVRFSPNDSP